MKQSVAYIIPTKGRPERLAELLNACQDTAAFKHSEFYVIIDNDEKELYAKTIEQFDFIHVQYKNPMYLVPKLNSVALELCNDFLAIGFLADDIVPTTQGWDTEIYNEISKVDFVWCNDNMHGEKLPNTPIMKSEIIQKLGYFCIAGLKHMYMDNGHNELIKRNIITHKYLSNVVLKHKHYTKGATMDATYKLSNNDVVFSHDAQVFDIWCQNLDTEIKKLFIKY